MESIAVTRPGMGVLSQEHLLMSPFGALAQTFSEEILARAQRGEGRWSYVPLDLLEEGEESLSAPAVPPVIQVDLHLVLEALRREKGESEQRRATERIVERILQIREVREKQAAPSAVQPRREKAESPLQAADVRQNIYQTLRQENRFGPFFLSANAAKGEEQPKGASAPGALGRQAAEFAQVLQSLREGVEPPPAEAGRQNGTEGEALSQLPTAASVIRIVPQEELTHQAESGAEDVQSGPSQARVLEQTARQAAEQLQDQVFRRVDRALNQERRHSGDRTGPGTDFPRGAEGQISRSNPEKQSLDGESAVSHPRERGESEQRRATERIVERILQNREVREKQAAPPAVRPRREKAESPLQAADVRQNIYQTLRQENRFGPFFLSANAAKGEEQHKGASAPGALGRQAAEFAQVLQSLREGLEPPPGETGRQNGTEGEALSQLPTAASATRVVPQEELAHRAESGAEDAQSGPSQARVLEQTARQAAEQLQDQVLRRVDRALNQERRHSGDRPGPGTDFQRGAERQTSHSNLEKQSSGVESTVSHPSKKKKTLQSAVSSQNRGQLERPEAARTGRGAEEAGEPSSAISGLSEQKQAGRASDQRRQGQPRFSGERAPAGAGGETRSTAGQGPQGRETGPAADLWEAQAVSAEPRQTGGAREPGPSPEFAAGVTAPISTAARDPRVGGAALEGALEVFQSSQPGGAEAEMEAYLLMPGAELTYWTEHGGETDGLAQDGRRSMGADLSRREKTGGAEGSRAQEQSGSAVHRGLPESGERAAGVKPADGSPQAALSQQTASQEKENLSTPAGVPAPGDGRQENLRRTANQSMEGQGRGTASHWNGERGASGGEAPTLSARRPGSAQDIRVLTEGLAVPGLLGTAAGLGDGEEPDRRGAAGKTRNVPPPGVELTYREEEMSQQSGTSGVSPIERGDPEKRPAHEAGRRQGGSVLQSGAAQAALEPGGLRQQGAVRPGLEYIRTGGEVPRAAQDIRTASMGRVTFGQTKPPQEGHSTVTGRKSLSEVELTHRPEGPSGGLSDTQRQSAAGAIQKGASSVQGAAAVAGFQTGERFSEVEAELGRPPQFHWTEAGGPPRAAREIRTLGPAADRGGVQSQSGSALGVREAEAFGAVSLEVWNPERPADGTPPGRKRDEGLRPGQSAKLEGGEPSRLGTAARDIRMGGSANRTGVVSAGGETAGGLGSEYGPLELHTVPVQQGAGPAAAPPAPGWTVSETADRSGAAAQSSGGPMESRGMHPSGQAHMKQEGRHQKSAARTAEPEPLDLTYGPAPAGAERPDPAQTVRESASTAESEYVRSLPDWARRFLRDGAAQSAQSMGTARSIATLSQPAEGDAVHWTAPNYRPPAAPVTYREKTGQEERKAAQQPPRISEAELQRTADQVYRMIEDRIRRERRRLGL